MKTRAFCENSQQLTAIFAKNSITNTGHGPEYISELRNIVRKYPHAGQIWHSIEQKNSVFRSFIRWRIYKLSFFFDKDLLLLIEVSLVVIPV